MPRPSILIHNAATGETVTREMDDDEFAQYEADHAAAAARKAAEQAETDAKATVRDSAIARFQKLGFTDAEISTLVLP